MFSVHSSNACSCDCFGVCGTSVKAPLRLNDTCRHWSEQTVILAGQVPDYFYGCISVQKLRLESIEISTVLYGNAMMPMWSCPFIDKTGQSGFGN